MDTKQFWRMIEAAKAESGDCEEQCDAQAERLNQSLSLLPAEDIAAFGNIFDLCRKDAYRWDLWGAACLINGGASDDGFEYFCRWLIGQGRAIYEAALADPDSLSSLITDDIKWGNAGLDCEELGYVAGEVYEQKAGREIPSDEAMFVTSEPVGVRWEEDDLNALYPKIAAKLSE